MAQLRSTRTWNGLALCLALLGSPAVALAQSTGSVSVDNYPQYGTAPDAPQTEQLRRIARAAVGAASAGAPLTINIFGHADFDARGAAFCQQVSLQRAEGARDALRSLVAEEAAKLSPPANVALISYRVQGLGTTQPIHANPVDDAQRRANRRVEFAWQTGSAPAPAPAPAPTRSAFQRCVGVLPGAAPGPVRRLTCVCNKLEQMPSAGDGYYDYRVHNVIPGNQGMPNLTPEQWEAAAKMLIKHMGTEISRAERGAPDADFRTGLLLLDDSVGRSINDFAAQMNQGAATGLFDRAILADIQNHMANPNHTYSCYAGYSRREHDK